MTTSSELLKIENPFRGGLSRLSYYVNVEFILNEEEIKIPMKVDTGASHTIVGTEVRGIKEIKNEILEKGIPRDPVYDASDNPLDLYKYNVKQFKLSKEIAISNVNINFSEALEDRAVLGMDILSWFNFSYKLENSGSNGYFTIHDYPASVNKILEYMSRNENNEFEPDGILTVDDTM